MEPEIAQMSSSSIESQKHTIGQLLKTILNKGDEWYLVDIRWFKQWKKYVGFDSWDMYNVGERSLYPGPIDNSGLFSDQETQALKEHLIDELDYVLVPTEAWNKLVSWYGCFEGQRPIVRKVIVHGLFVKHCKVEVYLLELKLCENHNMENVVTWHFSRGDTIETIEKEMRTLFSIPSEKETRLWNKYMSNKYEQLTNPQSTVQDAGLFQGQLIMIEHNKKDGLCTTQASNLNATPAGKLTPYLKLSSNPPVSLSPTGNGSSSSNRTKTFGISSKFQEKEQAEEVETNNMVLPVKQSNPCTSTAETFHSRKTEGAAQKSCLLPLNQFWYMSHTNKEGIKQIERKNKIKMVAQVHVTFEAEQEDGNPHEALSEFIDLSQSCSADSGQSVIPLKFVDPDQWSDALKVIKRNKDKILLTMSSEEVIVSGPKQSQDEFSAVLNAMQKTNTPAEQHKPALDDTSLRRINLTVNQQTKSPTVENNKQLKKSDEKQEGTINHQTKSPTVENIREPRLTSVQGTNVKAKSDLNVESSNSKNKQSLQTSRAKSFLESYRVKKKYFKHPLRLARHSDTTGLGGLPRKSSCENERKEDSSEPSLIPPTAQQNAEASTKKGASGDRKDDLCPICLGQLTKQKQLRCKHKFCDECLQESLKRTGPMCPVCKDVFGVMEGDQPDGVMTWSCNSSPLPGFSGCGSIVIAYTFPNGKQTEKHPNPGQPYQGTTRTAYLPDNEEGQEVLKLLKKAFDQKMIFTVGTSRTSGLDNQVIWNDISHKTSKTGGPQRFGYPDPNYLRKVKEDLKTKGIE